MDVTTCCKYVCLLMIVTGDFMESLFHAIIKTKEHLPTMVAVEAYILCRSDFLLDNSPVLYYDSKS